MWYSCRMHLYRRGNTIDRGVDTDGRAGGVVGIGFRNGNTTTTGRGVVESYTCGGSVGIRHGSGSITRHEVIYDCMSPQPTQISEEESEPLASH
ncbi:hypothetical protein Tco_1086811 [Tanacetum coccineum]